MQSSSNKKLGLILGVILIGAGLIFLIGELTGIASFGLLWPLVIIGIGIAFFIGMYLGGKSASALAIPGSILVMIGLILLVQNAFDLWLTWSYSWALIIVAVGIGLVIHGAYSERADLRASGVNLIHIGLGIFVIFGIILSVFWSAIGVSNQGYGIFGLLLVVFGAYLLLQRSYLLIKGRANWHDRDLFWPVIMLGVGLVFASLEFSQLELAQFEDLWRWWPLALVLLGIDWLIGRRWPVVGAVVAILIVVACLVLMFDPVLLNSFIQ